MKTTAAYSSIKKNEGADWKQKWASGSLFCVAAACFFFYGEAMYKKSKECTELKEKIQKVESLKKILLEEREELALELAAQGDDAWLEMVLKKRLGVVPEGQIKVYFKKDE